MIQSPLMPAAHAPRLADAIDESGRAAAQASAQLLSSTALLAGRSSVRIEHQGTEYILRATRAGKLILTK